MTDPGGRGRAAPAGVVLLEVPRLVATVVVSGALANKYGNGGEAWVRLSWALGFRQLGFDVCFVEQIHRDTCVDAAGAVAPFEESVNRDYFRRVTEAFGLKGSSALVLEEGREFFGLTGPELFDRVGGAELLINVSGHLSWEPLLRGIRRKAYVDIDPGFTQFWQAGGTPGARLQGHDFFFTVGTNLGTPDCPIPTCGIDWRPVRPPAVLDEWLVSTSPACDRFTTVASWRGAFGPVSFGGKNYGLKVHEFRKVLDLPGRVPGPAFEIALAIHPADDRDLQALHRHGWRTVDPRAVAFDPDDFRTYLRGSAAEFSVAQGIYVETGSGWFSDRTVHYLAAGKPVLVQDTGLARHYPVGEGLVTFRTPDEAAEGAGRIVRDYPAQCRAARALAEEYFDSDKVLAGVLAAVGLGG